MNRNRLITVALALLLVVSIVTVAEACPGCAEAQAGQGPDRVNVVRGYFWSIVFMMSMPFLMLSGFGGYCYLQVRKARAEREAASSAVATNTTASNTVATEELTPTA
jgi:hypothetical protein